jgi:hypothetical protein
MKGPVVVWHVLYSGTSLCGSQYSYPLLGESEGKQTAK